jgi:chromosome segregation ATPase
MAVDAVRRQREVLPGCKAALTKCRENLEGMQQKCADTLAELQQYSDGLQNKLEQLRQEVLILQDELVPYAETLRFDVATFPIAEMEENIVSLERDIEQRFRNVLNQTPDAEIETRNKIIVELDLLVELRQIRMELTDIAKNAIEAIKVTHATQKDLFDVVASSLRTEELSRVRQREQERISIYEDNLKKIVDLMKVDQISEWCRALTEVSTALAKTKAEQKAIEADFGPLLDDKLGAGELKEMSDRVEELLESNAKLVEQETELMGEIADLDEELFQVAEELESHKECPVGDDPDVIAVWEKRIKCKVCGVNKRDCFLVTCRHAVCRKCVDGAKGGCPVCGVKFSADAVKPFFFNE